MKIVDEIIKIHRKVANNMLPHGEKESLYYRELEHVFCEIESLRQRLAEAEAKMPKWLPIESAPQKRSAFDKLMVASFPIGARAYIEWPLRGDDLDHFTTMNGAFHEPTHYLLLPAPPEGDKEQ